MVIEDESTVQGVLKFHLERAGMQVSAYAAVEDALLGLEKADALVLDWMLPGESGLSFLRRLRADPELTFHIQLAPPTK